MSVGGRTTALRGAVTYEFKMQWRRWVMWLPVLAAAAIALIFASGGRSAYYRSFSAPAAVGTFALLFNFVTPIACGLVLADRLPRDGRLHVDEVLDSLPVSVGSRLWGKAAGAALATLAPWLLVEMVGFLLLAGDEHTPAVVPLGLAAFLAINLPALLVTAALSVVAPAVLWTPAYRFLFFGLWFWVGLDPTRIPSISGTLLSPYGAYAAAGFFGGRGGYAGLAGSVIPFGPLAPSPSPATAAISILVALAVAAGALSAGPALVRWRRAG